MKAYNNPVNMARKSVQESDELVTETLAAIYAQQGNFEKAISFYEKLSLKIPEKSAYFAALIKDLKKSMVDPIVVTYKIFITDLFLLNIAASLYLIIYKFPAL